MGVDLRLLPLLSPTFWAAHDMLMVNRRRELWPAIDALEQQEIPHPLSCFLATGKGGDPEYGTVLVDPYGSKLKWLTASALCTLRDHDAVTDNWQNGAVWAYLSEMPSAWPIVLWWH